jgi:hypothetical protein
MVMFFPLSGFVASVTVAIVFDSFSHQFGVVQFFLMSENSDQLL